MKACLDLLVSWLHTYIDNQGTGSRAFCDVALHGPFYAACQAVFYIVIFRHKQILDGNLKKGEQKFTRPGEQVGRKSLSGLDVGEGQAEPVGGVKRAIGLESLHSHKLSTFFSAGSNFFQCCCNFETSLNK